MSTTSAQPAATEKPKLLLGGEFRVVESPVPPVNHDESRYGRGMDVIAPNALGEGAAPLLLARFESAAYDADMRRLACAMSGIPEMMAACEMAQSLAYSIMNMDDPKEMKAAARRIWSAALHANNRSSLR